MHWVMDLNYCWGRVRRMKSGKLRRCVRTVRRLLLKNREETHAHLTKAFEDLTPPKADAVITEWLTTLDVMEEKSRCVSICQWTVQATDEEIDRSIEIVKAFSEKVTAQKSDLWAKLRWLPREEQLASLARLSDSFSQPCPGVFRCLFSRLKLSLGGGGCFLTRLTPP